MSDNEKDIGAKLIETLNEAAQVLSDGEKHYIKGVADGMLAAKACTQKEIREDGSKTQD